MKRILMVVALIMVMITADLSAQSMALINHSGKRIIGGSVDLSSLGNTTSTGGFDGIEYDDLQLNLTPYISHFISDKLAIGVSLNLDYKNRTYTDNSYGYYSYNDDSQFLTALLMPHVRFYLADNTFLHLEAGGGYRGYLGSGGDGDAMYGASISIGRDFPLSDDIFLEAAIGYSMMNYKEHVYFYYHDYVENVSANTLKISLGIVAAF